MSIEKNINYLKYKLLCNRQDELSYVPPVFVATITNNCNLKCPTCLYKLQNNGKFFNGNYMLPTDFRNVLINNDAKKAKIIYFTGGEPLLHPLLNDLLDISDDFDLQKKISTNGILLKKKIGLLTRFDEVNVSLDGHDYETFSKTRGSTKEVYNSIVDAIEFSRPAINKLSISFLLDQNNISKAKDMLEFSKRFFPNLVIFHNINPHSFEFADTCNKPILCHDLNYSQLYNLTNVNIDFDVTVSQIFNPSSYSFLSNQCKLPWFYFCFDGELKLSPCCHLQHTIKSDCEYANIYINDFNNKELVKIRKEKLIGSYSHKDCRFCQRRFLGDNFMTYNSKTKKWKINYPK